MKRNPSLSPISYLLLCILALSFAGANASAMDNNPATVFRLTESLPKLNTALSQSPQKPCAQEETCNWEIPNLSVEDIPQFEKKGEESQEHFIQRVITEKLGGTDPGSLELIDLADIPNKPFLIERNKVVKVTSKSETYFFKKLSCREAVPYLKLKGTGFTKPECILKRFQKDPEFSGIDVTLQAIPHFPEVSVFKERGLCKILMKKSPGDPVLDDFGSENLGKSIALMHALGLSHGDLHGNNVLRDHDSKKITVIDLDTMKPFSKNEYGQIDSQGNLENAFLDVDTLTQIKSICSNVESLLSSILRERADPLLPPGAEFDHKLEPVKKRIENAWSFFHSYESALPPANREKFRNEYLNPVISFRCVKSLEAFKRKFPAHDDWLKTRLPEIWECSHGRF